MRCIAYAQQGRQVPLSEPVYPDAQQPDLIPFVNLVRSAREEELRNVPPQLLESRGLYSSECPLGDDVRDLPVVASVDAHDDVATSSTEERGRFLWAPCQAKPEHIHRGRTGDRFQTGAAPHHG